MSRKKKEKKKNIIGVTVGGPTPNIQFQVDFNKKTHVILLPANPVYCAAVYGYTLKPTALNEMIAIFSHCIKRGKE